MLFGVSKSTCYLFLTSNQSQSEKNQPQSRSNQSFFSFSITQKQHIVHPLFPLAGQIVVEIDFNLNDFLKK